MKRKEQVIRISGKPNEGMFGFGKLGCELGREIPKSWGGKKIGSPAELRSWRSFEASAGNVNWGVPMKMSGIHQMESDPEVSKVKLKVDVDRIRRMRKVGRRRVEMWESELPQVEGGSKKFENRWKLLRKKVVSPVTFDCPIEVGIYSERLLEYELEFRVLLSGSMEIECVLGNDLFFESLIRIGTVKIWNKEESGYSRETFYGTC